MSAPVVRGASERDRQALAALWAELDALHASLHPGYFRRGPRPESFFQEALGEKLRALIVAELDGSLAGAVDVRLYDTPRNPLMTPARRAFVEDLVVTPSLRRRGIGRALMEAARAWGRARGAEELVLTVWAGNLEAEGFYARLGYRPLSQLLSLSL
jgi:ribosomal protein S18 acetylase RimI-like enzyme